MTRNLALVALSAIAALVAASQVVPARAQSAQILYVSGLRIDGSKPIAKVRLTNTSPNAADAFNVHYTIRETGAGIALSEVGAGLGAQLLPGHSLELDLGKIVALWRAAHDVGPYKGDVQFIAVAEGGYFREFGPDTIHVAATQVEGRALRDAVEHWVTP